MSAPSFATAGELIAALRQLEPDTKIVVSLPYDNDVAFSHDFDLISGVARHVESNFWDLRDPADREAGDVPVVALKGQP